MAEYSVERLVEIMRALRDPETGCPWDAAQDFRSIARYALEEAYELVDAIEQDDMDAMRSELGDLLLQVVFHAQMAQEQDLFGFDSVVDAICDKMVRRHPHVFGDAAVADGATVARNWEDIKEQERAEKNAQGGLLDDVPLAFPGLTRAVKLQKRAARVGFDWNDTHPVLAKLDEEIGELRAEMDSGAPHDRLEDELGDILFVVANLARHLGVDPETALRRTNDKFTRRFRWMESQRALATLSLEEMETLWQAAKTKLGKS